MIIEKGVEMIDLCENLRRILPIIAEAFSMHGNDVTVTAAKWGRDPLRLPHEAGHALDVKVPPFHEPETIALLTDALGLNYTIRHFKTHLHIEYTPMSTNLMKRQTEVIYGKQL